MDDLHPNSDDAENAENVNIPSDDAAEAADASDATDATDATMTAVTTNDSAGDASKESVAPANGVANPASETGAAQGATEDASVDEPPLTPEPDPNSSSSTDTDAGADAEAPDMDVSDDGTVPMVAITAATQGAATYSTIRELGRDNWGRILLAWRNNPQAADDQEPPVVLLERSGLNVEAARRIVEYHLYHARLLTPRAVVRRENNVHWLVVEAPATYEAPFTSIVDGGQMEARSALKAGVGLANALSYLHTNGVAHGHVAADAVLVHDGRAYLSGIEFASLVETNEASSAALFTADVNALAHVLAPLANLPPTAAEDEAAPAQALRAIVARADTTGFVTADDLAQECGQALQEPALTLPNVDESAIRPLLFHCGTATTVGLLRTQNQDALGCTVLDIRDDVGRDRPLGIFLVADGMGGEAAGEIASRIGARIAMAELVRQLLVPTVAMPALEPLSLELVTGVTSVATLAQALSIAVDAANRQVRALAAALQESTGTTLTALVVAGGQAVLAHLGDSRAYLFRNGALVQLTKDHSLLARLIELDHPLLNDPSFGMPRNYLYRSLGQEDEAPPDMMEFPIVPGDRLLLCSDGLWDELDDATLQRCLTSTDDPYECANHLVRLANAMGGHDNSTALVVFVTALQDDPAGEISPEEADAILRATGALGEDEGEANQDDAGVVDDAFDLGPNL